MKTLAFNLPTLMFVVGTRAALAAGLALLVAEKIPEPRRRRIGSILVAVGAATTVPAARTLLRQLRSTQHGPQDESLETGVVVMP